MQKYTIRKYALENTLRKKSLSKLIEETLRKFRKTEQKFEKNEKVEGGGCNLDAGRKYHLLAY